MEKILLVDDSPEFLETASLLISKFFSGYEVVCCSDGKQALDYLNDNSVALVITDTNMPVMNGPNLVKNIRFSGNKSTPILLLFSNYLEDPSLTEEDIFNLDASVILSKKDLPERFVAEIMRLLSAGVSGLCASYSS